MKEEIPIYVISLASDTERRKKLKERFPIHYSSFQFVDAIDFRKRKKEEIQNLYKECYHNKKRPLTTTEIACSISHHKAIKLFSQTQSTWCIILEDDIIGSDSNIYEAKNIIKKNTESDFFLLGGQDGMRNSKYIFGKEIGRNVWALEKLSLVFCTRACCYAVNKKTAEYFLQMNNKCIDRADIWERKLRYCKSIIFTNTFKHPIDLSSSHLEQQRKKEKGNIFKNIKQDGFINITKRNTLKVTLTILNILNYGKFPLR